MAQKQPKEVLEKNLKTKEVYFYEDQESGIKVKSREKYKNVKKIIHFPFSKRDGSLKYDSVKKITYIGYASESKLPRGFLKNYGTGYGFTKIYNPLIYRIESLFDINEIVIQDDEECVFKGKKLFLGAKALNRIYPQIDSLFKEQKKEKDYLVDDILVKLIPDDFKKKAKIEEKAYMQGALHRFIESNIRGEYKFSKEDIESLFQVITDLSSEYYIDNKKKVLIARETIEQFYVEDVIEEFEKLMQQKHETENLEEKWQVFFKKYSWIFSQLFSIPLMIHQDKAYMGGKGVSNKGGKIADFIYKNKFTKNTAIIEIKTHRSKLIKTTKYRGDDVFPLENDLSGGVNQVLDQKDNLQKDFYSIKGKSKEDFEVFNPKCVLLIGMLSEINEDQQKAFELIRSNSKDVDIVTFDELLEKVKTLQDIISGNLKEKE